MKVLLCVLLLVSAACAVYEDCDQRYCLDHPCSSGVSSSSCPPGTVYRARHAGLCGCCPACVTLLPQGASCSTYSREQGITPNAVCSGSMRCLTGRCVKNRGRN